MEAGKPPTVLDLENVRGGETRYCGMRRAGDTKSNSGQRFQSFAEAKTFEPHILEKLLGTYHE